MKPRWHLASRMKKSLHAFSLIPRFQPCGSKAKQSGLLEAWLRYLEGENEKPNQPVCSPIYPFVACLLLCSASQGSDHGGFMSVASVWAWPLDMLAGWGGGLEDEGKGSDSISLSFMAFLAVTF